MDTLLNALDGASAHDRQTYHPQFFRLTELRDRERLEALLIQEPRIVVHDELIGQLRELVRTQNPSRTYSRPELEAAAFARLNDTDPKNYGVWVYYPWSFRLVHLLDEAEFVQVRTDRNRNKITSEEQLTLSGKKVGVIGLSVGQSVSLTMALERTFGEIRLADFDDLELSNLNRIRSGVERMGINKAVNTAREIAELDPFLKVVCFVEGITQQNIDRFLTEGGKLDILVEECDSVDVKIFARQHARKLGIPVVMDMSDRGCLDVERFDLEPDRSIMHGWIDHLDLKAAGRPMTNEEKIPFMLPIVGTSTLSPRMKASMIEMGQTVGTWPQLATSVVLGGALAGDVCRRITLDQFHASGRWYVDLDEVVNDPKDMAPVSSAETTEANAIIGETELIARIGAADLPIDNDLALELATAGAFAPSAGNMQPWKFIHAKGKLLIVQDNGRSISRWDPSERMAQIALGACLENVLLRAQEMGHCLSWQVIAGGDPQRVVLELWVKGPAVESEGSAELNGLAREIERRCTNRKLSDRSSVNGTLGQELAEAARDIPGCSVRLFQDQEQLDAIAVACATAERVRLVDEEGHREFFEQEIRWTTHQAEQTRDGLDLATMELSAGDEAALHILADTEAMALVRNWGGGKGLERFSKKAIRTSDAVVLVSLKERSLVDRLNGGRAAQRVWLKATQLGISVHPISAPLFLAHAGPVLEDIDEVTRTVLREMYDGLLELYDSPDEEPLFMMRLGRGGEPSARSLRRPITEMFASH